MAELQEILSKGQSQISTHLAQLKQAGLVEDRRTGKNAFYRLNGPHGVDGSAAQGRQRDPRSGAGPASAASGARKRQDKMRRYFDELAGKFGRQYVPGRSWKGLAETLLQLMPPMVIADLGAGEGTISQLMAQRAKRVIAVDNSEKMVEFGSELAKQARHRQSGIPAGRSGRRADSHRHGGSRVSQPGLHHARHPERAVGEAWRILKPGGRIAILDLNRHNFEEAREMYADLWLGFTELEMERMIKGAGFKNAETAVVYREQDPPYLETLLAVADKATA